MPFDVEIEFTGLCLFDVSDRSPSKVTALLPKTGNFQLPCSGMDGVEHSAWLRFETALKGDPDDFDLSKGVSVTVGDPKAADVGRHFKKLTRGARPSGKDGDESSFHWIPSLQNVLHNADGASGPKLKDDCFAGDLPTTSVIARIHLHQGRLTTRRIAQWGVAPIIWEFKNRGAKKNPELWSQALGDRVVLRIERLEEAFPIGLTRKVDGSDETETIKVIPKDYDPDESNQVARLRITNEPPSSKTSKSLDHFLWYYELLETCPGELPIPTSARLPTNMDNSETTWIQALFRKFAIHILSTQNVFCPPATWDG